MKDNKIKESFRWLSGQMMEHNEQILLGYSIRVVVFYLYNIISLKIGMHIDHLWCWLLQVWSFH
jgi:hypothetical protein